MLFPTIPWAPLALVRGGGQAVQMFPAEMMAPAHSPKTDKDTPSPRQESESVQKESRAEGEGACCSDGWTGNRMDSPGPSKHRELLGAPVGGWQASLHRSLGRGSRCCCSWGKCWGGAQAQADPWHEYKNKISRSPWRSERATGPKCQSSYLMPKVLGGRISKGGGGREPLHPVSVLIRLLLPGSEG